MTVLLHLSYNIIRYSEWMYNSVNSEIASTFSFLKSGKLEEKKKWCIYLTVVYIII